MGNYSSKGNEIFNEISRSGSLYQAIMQNVKIELDCEVKSGETVSEMWTSREIEEYLKKKGW